MKVGEDSMTKKQENVECDVACESVEVQDMNIIVLNNSEEETSSEKDPKAICTNINLSNCNTTQAKNENSNSFNKEEETTDKKNSPELNTYVDPVPYAGQVFKICHFHTIMLNIFFIGHNKFESRKKIVKKTVYG